MKVLVLKPEMNISPVVQDSIEAQFAKEVKETLQYGYVFIPSGYGYEIIDIDVLIYDNQTKFAFDSDGELKAYPFYGYEDKNS